MDQKTPPKAGGKPYSGYHRDLAAEPDRFLTQVGRGTPGGEYLRRFWHPVAYVDELGKVPLRVRALGEDLVVFRDKGGAIGCLFMNCCHRNTSLEYGVIEDKGIRCCYHGRVYDVDGTILEMPGEPSLDALRRAVSQGAYPVHVFGGIVFIYMGPPERVPVFPMYDRFTLPGIEVVPGMRLPLDCNWIQLKENSVDPAHTAVLHVIPQLRGMEHFAGEFESFPNLMWTETPGGLAYMGARVVNGRIWVRSAETLGATIHCISSIFEGGHANKKANPPFITFWTLPVDDDRSINFFVSHVCQNEPMPFEQRRALEVFGQYEDRPYAERQWIPGDHDAMVSQGPINIHANERLGSLDRGVIMFRRFVRTGIETVQAGNDPVGFYLEQSQVAPTFANDYVADAAQLNGNPDDPEVISAFSRRLVERYLREPPMRELARQPVAAK
jgi:nitrite reductase/ring-hydroxylating ferredoxin subunit